jgi:hypothetical protein
MRGPDKPINPKRLTGPHVRIKNNFTPLPPIKMKKQYILVIAVVLILMSGQLAKAFYSGAYLKDFFNTGIDNINSFGTSLYEAQTFTATSTYRAGLVRLMLSKAPETQPERVFFRLCPTDFSGVPIFTAPLCSGELSANNWIQSLTLGNWEEIPCSPVIFLKENEKYSLVITGESENNTYWWGGVDTIAGTTAYFSTDGETWYAFQGTMGFEIYAVPEINSYVKNDTNGADFYVNQTIDYGQIILILFVLLFAIFGIVKAIADFWIPKRTDFKK